MTNKIILKNGPCKPPNGVLDNAELGFDYLNKKVYVGSSTVDEDGNYTVVPVTGATVDFDNAGPGESVVKYFIDAQRLGGLKAENYATKDYVTEKINEASIGGGGGGGGGGGSVPVEIEDIVTIDLDGAVEGSPNTINADTLGGRAASEYATESYVGIKIAEAQLGGGGNSEDIDLSGYATKEDLSGFITESALVDYAKKSEIPDVSAFQTAEQVSSLINEALGVIENGSY